VNVELFVLGDVALRILSTGSTPVMWTASNTAKRIARSCRNWSGEWVRKSLKSLPLLFARMVAIRLVGLVNGRVPALAPDSVTGDRGEGVANSL
jgi:hypothetical protein